MATIEALAEGKVRLPFTEQPVNTDIGLCARDTVTRAMGWQIALSRAEALQGSVEAGQDLEQKIEEALACPCVENLREGPCGKPFSEAFACYIRNFKTEKLGACYPKFQAMHTCMVSNLDAFSEFYQKGPQLDASKPS